MSSDHLDISSVWKSVVTSYVCVSEDRTRDSTCSSPARNTLVSSTKMFVSGPAQSVFVISNKHICL